MTGHPAKAELNHAANIAAARIITADPMKYPTGSLPAIWAAMILGPPAKRTAEGKEMMIKPRLPEIGTAWVYCIRAAIPERDEC